MVFILSTLSLLYLKFMVVYPLTPVLCVNYFYPTNSIPYLISISAHSPYVFIIYHTLWDHLHDIMGFFSYLTTSTVWTTPLHSLDITLQTTHTPLPFTRVTSLTDAHRVNLKLPQEFPSPFLAALMISLITLRLWPCYFMVIVTLMNDINWLYGNLMYKTSTVALKSLMSSSNVQWRSLTLNTVREWQQGWVDVSAKVIKKPGKASTTRVFTFSRLVY